MKDRDHFTALLAEKRRTDIASMLGMCGTFGALFFGQFLATKVYTAATTNLFSLHNDLIRKGEHDRAETTAQMATKAEVKPALDLVERERGQSLTWGKVTFIGMGIATISVMIGAAVAQWIGG